MRAFIFDKYGYYPDDEYANSFEYEGFFFKLESNSKTEIELESLNEFLQQVLSSIGKLKGEIIRNREQLLSSQSEFGQVSLVAIESGKSSIMDLLQIHRTFINFNFQERFKVSYLKALWESKVNMIEEKIIPAIKIDNFIYRYMSISTSYCIGLAENAIQYLSDITYDYSDDIINCTLVHKRLNSLNNYCMYNPFNYVVGSPMRDLAELFKAKQISKEELISILRYYSLTPFDASLLMARLLFPTDLFDLLEDQYSLKKSINREIIDFYENLNQKMKDLSYIYRYLVSTFNIRPIEWLAY